MDYDDLLKLHVAESTEKGKERYRSVESINDISPVGRVELERAKNLLSIVSPKSNLSLYDHLCSILRQILRFGIDNAVDKLEDISYALKKEKPNVEADIIEVTPTNEALSRFIEEKKKFYRLTPVISMEAIKTAEEDEAAEEKAAEEAEAIEKAAEEEAEEEEEEEEEEEVEQPEEEMEDDESTVDVAAALGDLHFSIQRFSLLGIGLTSIEIHDLYLAMKDVVETYKVEEVRFWGKILASTCNYYIVESKYNSEVVPEDFGWKFEEKQKPEAEDEGEGEEEEGEEEEEAEEEEEEKEISEEKVAESESQEATEPEEEVPTGPEIPPLPKSRIPKQKIVTPEAGGTGVNERLYFVTTQEEEEEENSSGIIKSESYETKSVIEMLAEGLEAWVHCKPAILDQGRCTPMPKEEEEEEVEKEEGEEENEEIEEGSEIFEAKMEEEIPLLRSISEDKGIGKLQPWNIRLSSKLYKRLSILFLESNLWPGALNFYDGKTFEHIYVGFGYKYSTYHYGPVIPVLFQKEYKADSDLLEPEDEEIEEPEPEEDEELLEDQEEGGQEEEEEEGEEEGGGEEGEEADDEVEEDED
ncbi:radial spoke head protein 4 homolog A [Trichonephila clavata]|uniref:Radial spoke head protein 4 homolog A n=1 Tax=Trichonephila clavata TaxID=2740835 RepID=A0A8X6EZP1_TRICU|nr:radial spoke head protein 4 homolog A [Trichonephila clavata]